MILWRCDICGKEGPWSDSWTWYGSYAQLDDIPSLLPTTCSEPCRKQLDERLRDGRVTLPEVSRCTGLVTKPGTGYGPYTTPEPAPASPPPKPPR